MEAFEKTLEYYYTFSGQCPYREWFYSLKSENDRDIIRARLDRVTKGHFGDCDPVGDGVLELRIHEGPGFRIYLARAEKTIVLLLIGGTKKKQSKDIALAKAFWAQHRRKLK